MDNYAQNYSRFMDSIGAVPGPTLENHIVNKKPDDLDDRPWIMICKVCEVTLNRFSGPDGEDTWVHSRAWRHYDHEPVAQQVERPAWHEANLLCDFCGRDQEVVWAYEGDRVQQTTGNFGNDYGHRWAACKPCASIIDQGDVYGLIDRVIAKSHVFRRVKGDDRKPLVDQLLDLHGKFLPTITSKTYIGPPVVPARLDPRLMPKVQQGLVRFWTHPTLYDRIIKPGHGVSVPGILVGIDHPEVMDEFRVPFYDDMLPRDTFDRHAEHLASGVEDANLYWVASNFTTLAVHAGQELKDVSITREELPAPSGLIIWEDPIGEIVRPHGTAGICAMSWCLVPEGVWLNAYIRGEDADPEMEDVAAMRAEYGWLMAPNIGTGLPFVGLGGVDDNFKRDGNFLLTLLATWFLMMQPGVATETMAPADKRQVRSARRAGKALPDVRIIDLRRHAQARQEPAESDAAGRKVTVRFMVHGHWKRQAYGPKRGLRKTIYIAPFMKGPDGAPLKVDPPTVRVLR